MTPVTIDRKDIEEAKRAAAFLDIECYFMDRKDDTDNVTMVIMSEQNFAVWHLARVMQMYVSEKMYAA